MNLFGAYGNMSFNQWHTPTSTGSHIPSHVPSMQANFPQDIMYSHILQSLNEMHETQAVINSRLTNLETTASPLSDLEDTLTMANNGQAQLTVWCKRIATSRKIKISAILE